MTREPDGGIRVLPRAVTGLAFDEHDLAVGAVAGALFYVDRAGHTAAALPWDNGADPFVEGRARTTRAGKVGFVDARLREVIPPRWDFAWPFAQGVAVVCDGCTRVPDGEHTRLEGGRWGYVGRAGRVLVPVRYPREDLPAHDEAVRRARAR